MKKFISMALAFVMLFGVVGSVPYTESLFTITAEASDDSCIATDSSYFMFELDWNGEAGVWITGFNGGISDVVIPSEYEGLPVIGIRELAFASCNEITSVVIPDSVENIKENAFNGCEQLTSATICGSVGESAFQGCYALENVTFLSGVEFIGKYAFSGCYALSDVTFLPGLKVIGEYAFDFCAIEELVFPDSLQRIEYRAFYSNMELETITFPAGLEYIDAESFSTCDFLLYIFYLGTRSQWDAINGGRILDYIDPIEPWNGIGIHYGSATHTINGYAYSQEATCTEDGEREKRCEYCSYTETEILPATGHKMNGWVLVRNSTCTTRGSRENHCLNCDYFESEDIPLERHDFVDDVCDDCGIEMYEYSFDDVYGHADLKRFNGYETAVIPDEVNGYPVMDIVNDAFVDKEYLTSVEFGSNVRVLPTFEGCSSLQNIIVSEDNETFVSVDGIVFSEDRATICKYPTGRTNKSYIIPDCVTAIDKDAFSYSEHLENIELHNNITEIGASAFSNCVNIVSMIIPDKVTVIGGSTLYGCTRLEKVVIGNGVKEIISHAFGDCKSLVSVKLGNGLERISNNAFNGCSALASIEIPYGTKKIGAYAFMNCTNLKTIVLPETITDMDYRAFSYSGISCIFYKGTAEQWDAIDFNPQTAKVHYETDYHVFEDNVCKYCAVKEFDYSWLGNEVTIKGYNGNSDEITIPEVLIDKTVTAIGADVFASAKVVVIPESVKSIKETAINTDAIIYCYENSYAHTFAEKYGFVYAFISIHSVSENAVIDYDEKLIRSSGELCNDLSEIFSTSSDYEVYIDGSPATDSTGYYGTGSVVEIYDGDTLVDSYTMIVNGDTNGDSVCDALDAAQVALVSSGNKTISGAYQMAADGNGDNIVDINDYQAIVNKAIS